MYRDNPDPLGQLGVRATKTLEMIGLAHNKYLWDMPFDKMHWLIENNLVDENHRWSSAGEELCEMYADMKLRHRTAFSKLSHSNRNLVKRRLRRTSGNFDEEATIARLAEYPWLLKMNSLGYQVDVLDHPDRPDYTRYSNLKTLTTKLQQGELAENLGAGYIDPLFVSVAHLTTLGYLRRTSDSIVVTRVGEKALTSYREFMSGAIAKVVIMAESDTSNKSFFKTFRSAAKVVGANERYAHQELLLRLGGKYFIDIYANSTIKRDINSAHRKLVSEYYEIVSKLSPIISAQCAMKDWLSTTPYYLSETLDPIGGHAYKDRLATDNNVNAKTDIGVSVINNGTQAYGEPVLVGV